MIDPSVIRRIQHMLAAGHTQRAVHRTLSVSRGTISNVAAGRRSPTPLSRAVSLQDQDIESGPTERCPGCGRLIEMPCKACRDEARNDLLGWIKWNAQKPR